MRDDSSEVPALPVATFIYGFYGLFLFFLFDTVNQREFVFSASVNS